MGSCTTDPQQYEGRPHSGGSRSKPMFARFYLRSRKAARRRGEDEHRRRLLEGVSGRIVDIGVGDGTDFSFYSSAVTEAIAIEPEPRLRAAAEDAAKGAAVPVRVIDGIAEHLPLADSSMDVAVVSLVLCTVSDQDRALNEIRRVLRPGGELRFYEHVHTRHQPLRWVLEAADRSTVWPRIAGGCHPTRDTKRAIERAGFAIEEYERFPFAAGALEPQVPHILGRARA